MAVKIEDIPVERVIRKAIELASADPEFVYKKHDPEETDGGQLDYAKTCRYVAEDGRGDCLFGQALVALGVSTDELSQHEGEGVGVVIGLGNFHPICTVQWRQDAGVPWGELIPNLERALVA